ncbi:MAG: type I 3-dehydroquinate dehydratase [Candidatus Micrarchaeota archaeon]|nr:type I 3-dehydroquinate dehydratase [Candidatus Micrarchaeota archaeon]MDE1864386.1 type I 3-dehydroquinate dehydratase [Candidatus Micrarchaeota archaeon]
MLRIPHSSQIVGSLSAGTERSLRSQIISAFQKGADRVEIRLDLLKRTEFSDSIRMLKNLAQDLRKRIIITNRPVEQGGKFYGSAKERSALLADVVAIVKPGMVDVEIDIARMLKGLDAKKIVSWHDFLRTPSHSELEQIFSYASRDGDVVKIVTMANGTYDVMQILKLYETARKLELVAFAMGYYGSISRVLCVIEGRGPMTYAYIDRPTAPGQFEITEMRQIFRNSRSH